jgi:dienelactone hydrolase
MKIMVIVPASMILPGIAGFMVWGLTPLGPADEALAAMESDGVVSVIEKDGFAVFTPAGAPPDTAFIFYPGGRIDYRSYSPIAREIAGRGYMVIIVKMPLSLAVFGVNKADKVITAYPDMRSWIIGGHSLGGAMAAVFASENPEKISGLALWASYPAGSADLSSTGLAGLTVYGSNDHVLDMEKFNGTLRQLPRGSILQKIKGGNHAQFGNYGPQTGDGTAEIPAAEQQLQTADMMVRLILEVEGD